MRSVALIFIALLLMLSLACQKSELETIRVNGQVTDSRSQTAIAGAQLTLQATEVSGGVYHGDYRDVATVESDANGNYAFAIETEKAVAYRIRVDASLYYLKSLDFDPVNLTKPEPANVVLSLDPMAWIDLRVNNVNPWDASDLITFSYSGIFQACADCCNNSILKGEGPVFHYSKVCSTIGAQDMAIKWAVTKKGNTKLYQDTIVVTSFDTIFYQIDY